MGNVQMASFGRLVHGSNDGVPECCKEMLEITYPIGFPSGRPDGKALGNVFQITAEELAVVDEFEVRRLLSLTL